MITHKSSLVLTLLVSVAAFVQTSCHSYPKNIYKVQMHGPINSRMSARIINAIKTSDARKGVLLMIDLNSPGGTIRETMDIVQAIDASRIPVIVFIAPGNRASGAACLAYLAADVKAMSTSAYLGDNPSRPLTDSTFQKKRSPTEIRLIELIRREFLSTATRYRVSEKTALRLLDRTGVFRGKETRAKRMLDLIVETEKQLYSRLHGYKLDSGIRKSLILQTTGFPIVSLE